jgi:hypothetical protein
MDCESYVMTSPLTFDASFELAARDRELTYPVFHYLDPVMELLELATAGHSHPPDALRSAPDPIRSSNAIRISSVCPVTDKCIAAA